jgi:hypothetical protein
MAECGGQISKNGLHSRHYRATRLIGRLRDKKIAAMKVPRNLIALVGKKFSRVLSVNAENIATFVVKAINKWAAHHELR